MSDKIVIAIDGNGGDNGSSYLAQALALVYKELQDKIYIHIFGPSSLQQELNQLNLPPSFYKLIPCHNNIPQDANARAVLKDYQDSSLYLAMRDVKEHRAHAMVSSGGTGPMVALARHMLGTIYNLRPCLMVKMPNVKRGTTLMLDLGANAQATARDLHDFAILAHCYSKGILQIAKPRIAILNVGTEDHKGSHIVQAAKGLIANDERLTDIGFIEANRIFKADTDVIVTDGFSGNVALKAAEGVALLFLRMEGFKGLIAKLISPRWLIPWHHNGSLLLGVNGIVVKSHGKAKHKGIAAAITGAYKEASLQVDHKLKLELDAIHQK